MTPLYEWAKRWGISSKAVADLQQNVLCTSVPTIQSSRVGTERALQQRVRIKASTQGRRLWRNNVGVAFREDGTPIRFGLANDSSKLHGHMRSADLIGITPVKITTEHIGFTLGVFTSWEIKKPGWVFNPNDLHSICQNNWNNLIVSLGGDGRFITSENQI